MSEIKLLPCPFCGGEAEFDDIHNPAVNKIICTKCGMHTGLHLTSKRGVAQIWNTRKPMERILKRLRQKEELEVVEGEKGSLEDARLDGYVKGIKKAIEVVKKEGGIEC